MSLDQVRSIVEKNFPMLIAEDLERSDGVSFFLGVPCRAGSKANRIIRAVRRSKSGPVAVKFAVSSRIEDKDKEFCFDGDEESFIRLVELEINLYEERICKA